MNIAESIKKKRMEHDLEMEELAKRCGVTKQMIFNIERGMRVPSLALAIAMADSFNCSIDELIGRRGA